MRTIEAGSRDILGEPDGYNPPPGVATDGTDPAQIAVAVQLNESTAWDEAAWDGGRIKSAMTYGVTGSGAAVELGPGVHRVWARVGDTPDRPVAWVDTLNVKALDATEVSIEDGGGAIADLDAVIDDGGGA